MVMAADSHVPQWVVQPWFYEGDGYDDESGTPHIIEAATRTEAREAFPVEEYTALNGLSVMTPEEWKARGGYPLEGLDA